MRGPLEFLPVDLICILRLGVSLRAMSALRHLTFHYTLRNKEGRVLDTSRGAEPLSCVEGAGQIIEGLEEFLLGMSAGETRQVVVPPERGYGLREDALIQKVPRNRLPVDGVQVGDQFQTGPDRQAPVVTVVAIEADEVLLDANHPLAGQELHFEVELIAMRPATPAELRATGAERGE
jgi:FKBP-type peptidyl-prolyl cis-trans isomerase SlyD